MESVLLPTILNGKSQTLQIPSAKKISGRVKLMFSKKDTKIDQIFTFYYVVSVKSSVKILSNFVALLETRTLNTIQKDNKLHLLT